MAPTKVIAGAFDPLDREGKVDADSRFDTSALVCDRSIAGDDPPRGTELEYR